MGKVIILKGLPASGKSTWAKDQVKYKSNLKRVNKDDLRSMLDVGEHSWENEKFILKVRNQIILRALDSGYDIIVDDTNLAPKHEREIRALVGPTVKVEVIFFDVDVEECIERDAKREGKANVGEKVIRGMHKKWESGWKDIDCSIPYATKGQKYVEDPTLPECIIVDIDGTLARMVGRSPYDWHRVYEDEVVEPVAQLVRKYYSDDNYKVIIFSGRDGSCEEDTVLWLKDHNIPYDELYMRKASDGRVDADIKEELFDKWINGRYNVAFVIDDRKQVKHMWTTKGLFVFDVNQHDEIF